MIIAIGKSVHAQSFHTQYEHTAGFPPVLSMVVVSDPTTYTNYMIGTDYHNRVFISPLSTDLPSPNPTNLSFFKLNSNVINTVGPVWRGGNNKEAELLANAYINSLKIAAEKQFKTIAFPSISTGVYSFPIDKATKIAVTETIKFLEQNKFPEKVIFCVFGKEVEEIYKEMFLNLNL